MTSSSSEPGGSRRLGPTETFYQVLINKHNASHFIHIAVINSSVQLSAAHVKKAFEVLSEQYEALRMRVVPIQDETVAFRFIPMKEPLVDLRLTKLCQKSDWPQLVMEENQSGIDCENGPLWKIVMAHIDNQSEKLNSNGPMKHQCLIMSKLHHAIVDAKSMVDVMYIHFMPVLAAVVNGESISGLVPKVHLYKPTEELFSSRPMDGNPPKVPWYLTLLLDIVRWKSRHFGASYEFKNRFFYPEEAELTQQDLLKLPQCQAELLEEALSTSILRAAKSHKVTVHCVFLAVNSIALCKTAKEAGLKLPGIIKQDWPIDLRKYLNWKSPQPLGAHTSKGATATKNQIHYSIREFWEMCKDIHVGVKQKSKKEVATALLGVVQYFLDASVKENLMDIISEFGMSSISSLSNAGVCDLGPPPVMSHGTAVTDMVEQYFTVTGMRRLNSTPFFHAVLTYRGRIAWNLTYNEANVSRRFVGEYLKNIKEVFWKYCGETAL